ncbi:hypothetical protein TKK_0010941 [Trichogramma kaykai]|uniref:Dynein regulatory complex protein 10 n=1 Tax=Trichogramma kaykai TaxID=54128 RepID=A0ABD2WVQ9_9HYME
MEIRELAIDRMDRILRRFSRKLEIAISIPVLLEQKVLKDLLSRREYEALVQLCAKSRSDDDIESSCDHGKAVVALGVTNHRSTKLLDWAVVLESLSQHEDRILECIDKQTLSEDAVAIIDRLGRLRQLLEWQMKSTPRQVRARKIDLRNAVSSIESVRQRISSLEEEFEEETAQYRQIVDDAQMDIDRLSSQIDKLAEQHRSKLRHEVHHFELALRDSKEDALGQENSLANQLRAHRVMLDELRAADLTQENELRQQCLIKEKANIAARRAYDDDLSKLHELKEALEKQLRLTDQHFNALEEEYRLQTEQYERLKRERELATMQAFADRLRNFERQRAARIIQRAWRQHLQRVLSAKKKKRARSRNK